MKVEQLALALILALVAGGSGYYLGAAKDQPVSELTADSLVALEYLGSAESFSEIERAGVMMDALAIRYAQQAQQMMVQDFLRRRAVAGKPQQDHSIRTAISLLEEALAEFRGMRQELTLLRPLLYALKHEQRYDQWLDCYLDVLYRHPNADRILELREEALRMGNTVNRAEEVAAAMQWMQRIPVNRPFRTRSVHAAKDQAPRPNLASG